jgi:hypothetical protein
MNENNPEHSTFNAQRSMAGTFGATFSWMFDVEC